METGNAAVVLKLPSVIQNFGCAVVSHVWCRFQHPVSESTTLDHTRYWDNYVHEQSRQHQFCTKYKLISAFHQTEETDLIQKEPKDRNNK